MWKKWVHFYTDGLWNFPLAELKGWRKTALHWLRITVLSIRGFFADKSTLWASSLTFYSLMSVVPILAMMFAIARGFGYQEYLRAELLVKFKDQKIALQELISFADKLIDQTHEGVIAGAGLVLLFWSVTSLLASLEDALNHIWDVGKMRSLRRIISDYFALMLIAPFFFILSNSAAVFFVDYFLFLLSKLHLSPAVMGVISFCVQLMPYALFGFLFTFLYYFMPNIRVRMNAAFTGGIVAGTLYVIAQWGYIYFQVGVSRYGAIYGSFAALPLFLIWLQVSWLILLFGAQVCHAHQTLLSHEFQPAIQKASPGFKKISMLWIMQVAAKRFEKHSKPITVEWIMHHCNFPLGLAKPLIEELAASGLLNELKSGAFVPSMPVENLKIVDVLLAIETHGISDFPFIRSKELERFESAIKSFSELLQSSDQNLLLLEMEHDHPI